MLSFNRDEYDLSGNGKDQLSVFEPDKERLLKLVNTLVNRINSRSTQREGGSKSLRKA